MMKHPAFKQSLLVAAVAMSMGVTGSAMASTTTSEISPSTKPSIKNIANATYKVDGQTQPQVDSNEVEVLIREVAKFSLVSTIDDGTAGDDKNTDQTAPVSGGTTTFEHKLKNDGNVTDTYTITTTNNNDATITTDEKDEYQFSSLSSVTYKIFKDGDDLITATPQNGATGTTIASGGTITLKPDEFAILTYTATTPATAKGGQTDTSTLSATSTYINSIDATKATLINEDQAIVKMPVFQITKSSTATNVDLNTKTEIPYTITVKNDGSATYAIDATKVAIKDVLPTGLTVKTGSINVSSDNTTTTNNGTASITTTAVTNDTIQITGADIAVNETLTITFTAIIDKTTIGTSATNNATVYDAVDDSKDPLTNPDTTDSTNPDTPDNPGTTDDSEDGTGTGGDTPSTITFTQRGLTIGVDQAAEVPPTSTTNTNADYAPVIKNTGRETEGDTAGEVTFKITNTTTGNHITPSTPVTITYDVDGDPTTTTDQTTYTITPDGNGVYDINTVLPSGMAPNSTVTINYSVNSKTATSATVDTTEVTLIPGGTNPPTAGTTTTTDFKVTDTTTVKSLSLLKEQALDANCDGTADGTFATTQITATPNQCVVYKITATNNFTSLAVTDVLIYDTTARFDKGTLADTSDDVATYQNDGKTFNNTGNDTTATVPVSHNATNTATGGNAIYATIPTIAAGQKASMTFSVKINP